MIGKIFNNIQSAGASQSSHSHSQPTALESATEESHTRHLLYPDSSTFYHPDGQPYPLHAAPLTPGSGHDGPLPEIDLDVTRDCRIIIAQDESGGMPKAILFDSKPSPPRADSPTQHNARLRATLGPTAGGIHARRSSLVTEPSAPRSPTMSGFTRTRVRGGSVSSMPNIDEHAQSQARAQAKAKESTDIANICLDCCFGNLPMGFRGNSNKIHILPLDNSTQSADSPPLASGAQDTTGSLGRAEGVRRRSHLAKSFTPANLPTDLPRSGSNDSISKEPKRRTMFITRMFSVTVPEDDADDQTPTLQSSLPKGNGFPFPASSNKPGASRPSASQIRKAPMYAITIILHLPIAHTSPTLRPPSRGGNLRSASRLSTSVPGQDSLGSSLDSDRRAGWAFIEPPHGVDSFLSSSFSSDVDDRVDVVGQHWDVIQRAVTSLQYVVQERILAQFKSPEMMSPPIIQQHRQQASRSSLKDFPSHALRRPLRLQPNALQMDRDIQAAVKMTGPRVVNGMRIPRVLTGQGKWGVWREEARWLARWAGKKEQNFFFYNLLTAFLGNHTEWLNVLGPKWHRKRHREQQKAAAGENLTIPNRTIIVSPDKMAARRLIFLLAAFLPPNPATVCENGVFLRPGTSASFRAYSQSPPTNVPPSRKQSLRRQIRRKPNGKQSMSNVLLQPPTASSGHQPPVDMANERSETARADMLNAERPPAHSRRSSTHSIRTSLVMPAMSGGPATNKNNIPTTSTAMSETAVPLAHFMPPRARSFGPTPGLRPESSDSLASANLFNTLQRSGTGQTSIASNESSTNSRWSGFMNFWGGRRASSTDQSDYLQTTDDGIGYRGQERPVSQLEQMVQELSMDGMFGEGELPEQRFSETEPAHTESGDTFPMGGSSGVPASAARPIPERPKTFDAQFKLSVNEKDGVIDVDIPLPDFDSPLQSPLLGVYGSVSSHHGSSYGESSILSLPYCESEQPVNAAGWLSQFHQDFAIQAVRPYKDKDFEADIKRAMSAEPTPLATVTTPSLESGPLERWVDVCSALVADSRNFKIRRIRLRRRVKLIPTPTYQTSAMTPSVSGMPPGRSQYGNPYASGSAVPMMTEVHLEEKFIDEVIMDFDAKLADGIDRALAQSGDVTRANSAQSSRSSSRRGHHDKRTEAEVSQHVEVPQADCKGVIFDALETVVKDVTAARGGKDDSKRDHDTLKPVKTATDSSLKEGIRRWLVEVE